MNTAKNVIITALATFIFAMFLFGMLLEDYDSQVHVCIDGKMETVEVNDSETQNRECKFLKELKGASEEKQYYLWRCGDDLELYSFNK